jgi:hypothetical protein
MKKPAVLPLSFLAFCIELYAEHKNIGSPAVYSLFVKTGLLDMLVSDYEDLHGMSFEYLMQFFDDYLKPPLEAAEKSPVYPSKAECTIPPSEEHT